MDLETFKQQVVAKVESTEDEALLYEVLYLLSDDRLDDNEILYRRRLETSIRQADSEQVISVEDVYTRARQWIAADKKLTQACMQASEETLAKEWKNEEDERWQSFLKD